MLDRAAVPARKSANPKGCILLLEDDAHIHNLLERWLTESGYELAAEQGAQPQLVILNVADPQNAASAVESLRREYAAPILALSARFHRGLAGSAEVARRLAVAKVLPKPFTRGELLAAVREALQCKG
jgi:DNA-binding response OmpR family regulator